MDFSRLILVVTDIFMPLAAGYLAREHKLISKEACDRLIRFNVVVMNTVMVLMSFWVMPLSAHLLFLPLYGIFLTVFPGAIGHFMAKDLTDWLQKGSYVISCLLSNIGTLSGISAYIIYGETGFAFVQLIAMSQNILLVAMCFPLARYYRARHDAVEEKAKLHLSFKDMFLTVNQLSLLGMAAGIALQLFGIERPPALGALFHNLVHILGWVSLFPVGYLIDFGRAGHYYRTVRSMLLIRFVIVPAVSLFFIRLIFDDPIIRGAMFLVAFSPGAINAVITSQLYRLNTDLSVAAFLLTTAVYLPVIYPLYFIFIYLGGKI